jgi:hypothetical protein
MLSIEYKFRPSLIAPSAVFPGHIVWRPVTNATLVASNGQTFRCSVLLDTGADHCAFPASFASLLGLDILRMKSCIIGGVGNLSSITYYDSLEVDLGDGIRFKSLMGFTDGLEKQGFGVLGHLGFFEYYDVHFSRKDLKFTIQTT